MRVLTLLVTIEPLTFRRASEIIRILDTVSMGCVVYAFNVIHACRVCVASVTMPYKDAEQANAGA